MRPLCFSILLVGGLSLGVLLAEGPPPTYLGAEGCAPCHREQHQDWQKSAHARAWASLEKEGKTGDPECVPCHVTGPLAEGNAPVAERAVHRNVQCEACHGPGSFHAQVNFILTREGPRSTLPPPEGGYEPICLRCHDPQHSLNFRFPRAVKQIDHSPEPFEPSRWTEETAYIGSTACQPCHPAEHAQWAGTKHATAFAALKTPEEHRDPRCLACHTTAYDERQGFVSAAETPDLANVGCEVCHGPGGDHLTAPPEKKKETIFGLGSRCPSCAIHKLCRRCHTPSHDPNFASRFNEALARVKHR